MEKWIRWEPINNVSGRYYIDSLTISEDWDLIIKLSNSDDSQKINILFEGPIDSFRCTNESFCFKIFGDLSDQYGADFYVHWSFFKIENSDYLQWLSEKSRTVSDNFPFQHFCIIGNDEVLDILSQYEPQVKFIT